MNRLYRKRVRLSCTLTATSPVATGGEDGGQGDAPLFVDGQGRYCVPGTSFGTLKAMLERFASIDGAWIPSTVERLFGPELGGESSRDKAAQASRLSIADAVVANVRGASRLAAELPRGGTVVGPETLHPVLEDGVAINRRFGSAAEGLKFDRTVLPIGTQLEFSADLILDDELLPHEKGVLGVLAYALSCGRFSVGAGKTNGSGRLQTSDIKVATFDYTSAPTTIASLRARSHPVESTPLVAISPAHDGYTDFFVRWKPARPVMQSTLGPGDIDIVPLVTPAGRDDGVRLVIKGRGVRALRSISEWFVRSATEEDAPEGRAQFEQREEVLALVYALWGEPRRKDGRGRAGAITTHYCMSEAVIPRTNWEHLTHQLRGWEQSRSRIGQTVAEFNQGPSQVRLQHTDHNAINRWTGGASKGALFDRLVVAAADWQPLHLELDRVFLEQTLPNEQDRRAAYALLLFTLRSLHEGAGGLGFGFTRGLGGVEICGVEVKREGDTRTTGSSWWADLLQISEYAFGVDRHALQKAWQEWVVRHKRTGGRE